MAQRRPWDIGAQIPRLTELIDTRRLGLSPRSNPPPALPQYLLAARKPQAAGPPVRSRSTELTTSTMSSPNLSPTAPLGMWSQSRE